MNQQFFDKKVLVYAVVIAVLSGVVGGSVGYRLASRRSSDTNQPLKNVTEQRTYLEESDYISAIQKVSPAVVSIIQTKDVPVYYQQPYPFFEGDPFFQQFFGQQFQPQPKQQQQKPETQRRKIGGGSGFIVTSDGLVVTNRHVVNDPKADYTVILSDGRELKGEVIGKDTLNDLAVIQIKSKDGAQKVSSLPVLEFGDSDVLRVGQRVLAVGNALGEYQNTVTAGIISATGRHITASDRAGAAESLSGLLQTDAAINPGNSGGPLVNMKGQVIGVNVAIAASANNIGFAIPFNDVRPVIESVQKHGKVIRPFIGVRYQILTDDKAKELQLQGVTDGALLVGDEGKGEFAVIPGGPGDKAGLKKGDVILEVDGKKITQDYSLQHSIRNKNPGDKVTLKVWTSGKTVEKTLTLGETPST